jgi:hypothetical protein
MLAPGVLGRLGNEASKAMPGGAVVAQPAWAAADAATARRDARAAKVARDVMREPVSRAL